MAKQKTGLTIFPKLLLTMIFVSLIPLGGLWYNVFKAQEDWKDNLSLRLTQNSHFLVNQVDNWVNKNQRALRNSAMLEDVTSMEGRRQKPVLTALLKTYEWSYLTHVVNLDGYNVSRSDDKAPKFYGDREYFKQVLSGQPFGYQVLIGRTSGKPALVISAPITSPETGELIGGLQLAAHLTDISNAVADVRIGETGHAILLDQAGKAVAHGKPGKLAKYLQDMSDHPAFQKGALGKQLVYTDNGRQIVAYSTKTKNGWTMIVQQDYDEAFGPMIEAQRNSLILLGLTLSLVFLATLMFARRMVKPIRRLTDIAGDYSRGKLNAKIPGTLRGDEIGALARAVERMGVSIKMAFDELRNSARAA